MNCCIQFSFAFTKLLFSLWFLLFCGKDWTWNQMITANVLFYFLFLITFLFWHLIAIKCHDNLDKSKIKTHQYVECVWYFMSNGKCNIDAPVTVFYCIIFHFFIIFFKNSNLPNVIDTIKSSSASACMKCYRTFVWAIK